MIVIVFVTVPSPARAYGILIESPPIPAMRIVETVKRFLLSPRLMSLNILRPLTAMKP